MANVNNCFNVRLTLTLLFRVGDRLFLLKNMKQLYTCFLLIGVITGLTVHAQTFSTRVSAKSIGKKDAVQVEYIAENLELQDLILPVFNGWSILSGPNFSSNRLQTGNIIKQQVIYTLTLQPQATGRLTIPGAKATIDNKVKLSNTVVVEVKNTDHVQGNNAAPAPGIVPGFDDPMLMDEEMNDDQVLRKGESARDKINKNLLVRLDVNKKTAFVGEPILATYKLCTRIRSQSRVIKQPAFSGATVLEMTSDDPLPKKEKIGNKWYNVYIIRQVQLIPLRAGPLHLPQASVENKVTFYREGQLNYRDLFYNNPAVKPEEVIVTFTNPALNVSIINLPQPAPEGFSGAVGNFSVHINSISEGGQTSNGNELQLIINGNGNLQQIKPPVINWPVGIEGFDATEKENIDKTTYPATITKTIVYPYVATKSGDFTIPPITFAYFNANQKKYVSLFTKPVTLHVKKGSKSILPAAIKNYSNEFYARSYLLLGGALLIILLGLILYNKKKHPIPQKTALTSLNQQVIVAAPEIDTEQFIFEIRELEPGVDGPLFYKKLDRSLTAWLLGKYNMAATELSGYAIQHPDKAHSMLTLANVLDSCRVGMYTPLYNVEEAMQHRMMALEAINNLEKMG